MSKTLTRKLTHSHTRTHLYMCGTPTSPLQAYTAHTNFNRFHIIRSVASVYHVGAFAHCVSYMLCAVLRGMCVSDLLRAHSASQDRCRETQRCHTTWHYAAT